MQPAPHHLLPLLLGCSQAVERCPDGFARWPDGNCYPSTLEGTGSAPTLPSSSTSMPTETTVPSSTSEDRRYDGPVYVEDATAVCNPADTTLQVLTRTRGWAMLASVAIFRTEGDPTDEEHDVFQLAWDDDGWWNELGVGPLDAAAESTVRNHATRLRCAELDELTFAVRIYELDGSLVDCAAWGHDVSSVRSGTATYDSLTGSTDLSECFDLTGSL